MWGGNSASPERIQKETAPAACSVRSRSQQKSFLFLLEEKIGHAQIKKCEENFFAGWRASASGGGAASLVGVLLKKSSDFNQKVPPIFRLRLLGDCCLVPPEAGDENSLALFPKTKTPAYREGFLFYTKPRHPYMGGGVNS